MEVGRGVGLGQGNLVCGGIKGVGHGKGELVWEGIAGVGAVPRPWQCLALLFHHFGKRLAAFLSRVRLISTLENCKEFREFNL